LLLPLAVRTLRAAKLEGIDKPTIGQRVTAAWNTYGGNRYLGIAIAATFVAIVLVFLLGLEFFTARDAALAGFAWESFINKLVGGAGSGAPGSASENQTNPSD
jgi:hypothetical protein